MQKGRQDAKVAINQGDLIVTQSEPALRQRIQQEVAHLQHLPQEVETLKNIINMKNDLIYQLRAAVESVGGHH